MKENVTQFNKGLHTDNSYASQPKGTYTFALNAVTETNNGDSNNRSNENSNGPCGVLPNGYIPLGKIYIGDNETLIFSVSPDESLSEIGIMNDNCIYETHVNADLGFRLNKQIQATYRLRRGCEKTVYFVSPKPMIYNINRPDDFKSNGNWDPSKFGLFKTYDLIPIFSRIEILESGNLAAGSYNASIQYLDEDLNPTEWITTTDTIIIYNDSTNKPFPDIEGSTNKETQYQKFGLSNKSIKFTISNLDTNYPFYRIAVIEANTGNGQISAVKYSQEISTQINVFNYTGASASIGTKEEILAFNSIIDSAEAIAQIENKLILAGTKGKQINLCKLQSYASRIKADLTTQEIILNSVDFDNNQKRGTVHVELVGYMPGEMYSFAIVYIFSDGTVSPAYHIPGRSWNIGTMTGYFSKMSYNNKLEDTFYTDNNSCVGGEYWGLDSEGIPLLNQPVRHHRFPLRSEVNKPLLVEEILSDNTFPINVLTLNISGVITSELESIPYSVVYSIDGNESTYETLINVATYDPVLGITVNITNSPNPITVIGIYENGILVSGTSDSGLDYETSIEERIIESEDKLYKSEIFGIKFSGIDMPIPSDTGGEEVIGFYIVRNERTEEEKSIVDTGVLLPLINHEIGVTRFASHAHLMPIVEPSRLQPDMYAVIHPEHKFGSREYKNVDTLVKEGDYQLKSRSFSDMRIQDVMAGTSYDEGVSKRRERDNDGFDLHLGARDNELKYVKRNVTIAEPGDIKEIFYLDALNSKVVSDQTATGIEVFNISGDNKIGIIQMQEPVENIGSLLTSLPFVVMKRKLSNQYSNFRVLPYYKDSENYHKFLDSTEEVSIFNGDSYISPMRYHSSIFYDIRLRKRASKKGLWNIILGAIAIVVGAVLTYFGGGALGVMLIAYGISSIASGIKKDDIAKVYSELYDAGLRDTVSDGTTSGAFGPNPPDDEVQWLGDTLTNLWFESSANMNIRQGSTINIPDFLQAPANKAVNFPSGVGGAPQNELDAYLLNKLTALDADNGDGRVYQGYSTAELYEINPDYRRRNKEKIFFHLGLEYRCCSDCIEDFPHRVHSSETSFQEELTDNYRTFLPNNYRDIEGESGKITDVFRIQNNLYIHTTESLWHLQPDIQERVTGDIVSFLGTGNFLSVPPKKILDDEISSAGNRHKWGREKTRHGIFFPSENEGKIYQFDGNKLIPISDRGNYSWFKNNMKLKLNEQYKELTGREYPYNNNPSNPFGIGFISVYDSLLERWILTKKDFILSEEVTELPDFELCINNGEVIAFPNFNQIIEDKRTEGFSYIGMEECRMKFSKTEYRAETQTRTIEVTIPNNANIYAFYDTSGSFLAPQLEQIRNSVDAWFEQFQSDNPDFEGTITHLNDSTERWVNYLSLAGTMPGENVIVLSFCNEAQGGATTQANYHGLSFINPVDNQPAGNYVLDYNNFIALHATLGSFIGINYPIITSNVPALGGAFLQHSILAINGVPMTLSEAQNLERNTAFNDFEWNSFLATMQAPNPYQPLGAGLKEYGWQYKSNKNDFGTPDTDTCPASTEIISACQFAEDINELLAATVTTEEITVDVLVPYTQYAYVSGTPISNPVKANGSWTMSYSLKDEAWVGWHSYMPNFYFYISDKFYAWINGSSNLWKFNRKHHYQNFFGQDYPHIIEYVSNPDELKTKIWNHIRLLTEAKQYSEEYEDFVDMRYVTFNKMIAYNTRQSTGLANLVVKDTKANPQFYLEQQTENNFEDIIIDRNERDWTINDLRDIRINYNIPIFRKDLTSLQDSYYIDKILNQDSLDPEKDWSQLESFMDKYLVVRFIFDNFDTIRLITNFSVENEQDSYR